MKLQSLGMSALVATFCSSAVLAGASSSQTPKVSAPLPGKSVKTSRVEFKEKGRKNTAAGTTSDGESDDERTLKRIEREALEKALAARESGKAANAPQIVARRAR